MAGVNVISALREKRARRAGELAHTQLRILALKTDLANIDACLRIFQADVDPESIPAKATLGKSPAGLSKGVGPRTALEILRETGQAMSAYEIAACVLQRWERPMDPKSIMMLSKNIQKTFKLHRVGIVEFDRSTYPGRWRLVRRE
jgi:hypothetical protein